MEGQRALDAADCLTLEPVLQAIADKFAGGIYSDGDEAADCYRFCQTLEQRLVESGQYQRMIGFSHSASHIHAIELAEADSLSADHYVLAAGNESDKLAAKLGIHLPLYPLKGYSLTLSLSADAVVPDTSVTDFDNKVVYARLGDKLRVAAMVDIGARHNEPDLRRLAALRKLCADTFPQAGDYNRAQAWAGLRPSTPKGPPIIGASPFNNFWLNTGHGSLGFTLACASGHTLAELIDGRPAPVSLEGLNL